MAGRTRASQTATPPGATVRELDPAAAMRAELEALRAELSSRSDRLERELAAAAEATRAALERERAAAERAAAAEAIAAHTAAQADRMLAAPKARPSAREVDPLEAIEAQLEMGQRIAERFAPREPVRPSLTGPEILAAVKLLCSEIGGMVRAHHEAATERALALRLAEIDAAQARAQAGPAAPEAEPAE